MALVINNVSNGNFTDDTSFSYDGGTGTRVLIIFFGIDDSSDDIVGVTYGGQSMLEGGKVISDATAAVQFFYLQNPSSDGSQTVAINALSSDSYTRSIMYVTGTDPTDAIGTIRANAADIGDSTGPNVNITPQQTGSLLLAGFCSDTASAMAATGGSAEVADSGTAIRLGVYSKTSTSTSSHNIACTSGDDDWAALAVEILPLSASTADVNDAISITENVQTQVTTTHQANVFDAVSIAEDVQRVLTANRGDVFDAIAITDIPFFYEETIIITEYVVAELEEGDVTYEVTDAFDAISIAEDVAQTQVFNASVADDVSITDVVTAREVSIFINVTQDISIAENVNQTQVFNASVSDDVSVSDVLTNQAQIMEVPGAFEAISVTDVVTAREVSIFISVGEDISIDEDVNQTQVFTASVADDVGVADVVTAREVSIFISAGEDISITDVVTAREVSIFITVTEDVSIAEDVNQTQVFNVSVADDVSVSDVVVQLELTIEITVTQDIDIEDEAFSSGAQVGDDISITEDVQTEVQMFVSVGDDVGVTDVVTTLEKVMFVSAGEDISITEDVSQTQVYTASVTDDVSIADAVTAREVVLFVDASDSVSIADVVTAREVSIFINVTQDITIEEDVSQTQVFTASVSDLISIAEDVQNLRTILQSTGEDVSVADVVTAREVSIFITVTDDITVEDVASINPNASVGDDIGVTDVVTAREVSIFIDVSDTVTITENAPSSVSTDLSVSDSVSIAEDIQRLLIQNLSTGEDISITEDVTTDFTWATSVYDQITCTEDVTTEVNAFVSTDDDISIAEDVQTNQILTPGDVVDSISITESQSFERFVFSQFPAQYRPRGDVEPRQYYGGAVKPPQFQGSVASQ